MSANEQGTSIGTPARHDQSVIASLIVQAPETAKPDRQVRESKVAPSHVSAGTWLQVSVTGADLQLLFATIKMYMISTL